MEKLSAPMLEEKLAMLDYLKEHSTHKITHTILDGVLKGFLMVAWTDAIFIVHADFEPNSTAKYRCTSTDCVCVVPFNRGDLLLTDVESTHRVLSCIFLQYKQGLAIHNNDFNDTPRTMITFWVGWAMPSL